MCYVIYTGACRERTAQKMIIKLVPHELYSRVFYPFRHMLKKIGGNWADIYEWLIPGYLFVITDRVNDFYAALRRVPRLTKLLGRVNDDALPEFQPISPEEENWLRRLLGDYWFDPALDAASADLAGAGTDLREDDDSAAIAAISTIDFDEHDRVRILSGPLMSFTAQVRHIDLHRRFAEVEVPFMGQTQRLRLGLEILVKDK